MQASSLAGVDKQNSMEEEAAGGIKIEEVLTDESKSLSGTGALGDARKRGVLLFFALAIFTKA